jgi:hypothetical protein
MRWFHRASLSEKTHRVFGPLDNLIYMLRPIGRYTSTRTRRAFRLKDKKQMEVIFCGCFTDGPCDISAHFSGPSRSEAEN